MGPTVRLPSTEASSVPQANASSSGHATENGRRRDGDLDSAAVPTRHTVAEACVPRKARRRLAACGIRTPVLAILGLGFALGMRHALDADHVAAVSTLAARARGVRASSLAGAVWGLGHTLALIVVALLVVFLQVRLPAPVATLLELSVAVMLVALGVDLLRRRRSGAAPRAFRARRPFLIGMLHGLAGSASLMLAVLATIPERGQALTYVAAFGMGSVGGMAIMSAALSVPLGRLPRSLGTSAALASITIGALLAWDVGRAAGWLT